MAKLEIVRVGSPVLHIKAQPVGAGLFGSPELRRLVDDMKETMLANGVGLAAPQVNVPLRIIVLEDRLQNIRKKPADENARRKRVPFAFRAIINPVLRPRGRKTVIDVEGCLSVPGLLGKVSRYYAVDVTGFDVSGRPIAPWRTEGWPARILQHEVDHLDGILYLERAVHGSITPAGDISAKPLLTAGDLGGWLRDLRLIRGL